MNEIIVRMPKVPEFRHCLDRYKQKIMANSDLGGAL